MKIKETRADGCGTSSLTFLVDVWWERQQAHAQNKLGQELSDQQFRPAPRRRPPSKRGPLRRAYGDSRHRAWGR